MASSAASHDRFYGQRDLAMLCCQVVSALFSVRPQQQQSSAYPFRKGYDTPPDSPVPNADAKQPPPLAEFIAYALYRTRLPLPVVHQALLLLARLKGRYPSARGTSTSPHRLFLSALMLSSKIVMDDTYSNKSWAIVGGNLFALSEVNQMERELFAFLGYNVVVRPEELDIFVKKITCTTNPPSTSAEIVAVAVDPNGTAAAAQAAAQAHANAAANPKRRRRSTASPSPNRERHQRAADAAMALLQPSNIAPRSHSISNPASLSTPPISPQPDNTNNNNCTSKCCNPTSTAAAPTSRVPSVPMSPCSTASTRSPATPITNYQNNNINQYNQQYYYNNNPKLQNNASNSSASSAAATPHYSLSRHNHGHHHYHHHNHHRYEYHPYSSPSVYAKDPRSKLSSTTYPYNYQQQQVVQ